MKSKPTCSQTPASRVVKTSRWVHTNQLKVGMYVRELDCAWEDTDFMFQGFVIDTLSCLHDVQRVSEYACIESETISRNPSSAHLQIRANA